MDLREFIKATLLDLMSGIHDAQTEWHARTDGTGAINPAWGGAGEKHVQEVSFDVAVTAETARADKGSAGIKVMGIGIGGELADSATNSTVSRIQFKVPVIAPVIAVTEPPPPPVNWTPSRVV